MRNWKKIEREGKSPTLPERGEGCPPPAPLTYIKIYIYLLYIFDIIVTLHRYTRRCARTRNNSKDK